MTERVAVRDAAREVLRFRGRCDSGWAPPLLVASAHDIDVVVGKDPVPANALADAKRTRQLLDALDRKAQRVCGLSRRVQSVYPCQTDPSSTSATRKYRLGSSTDRTTCVHPAQTFRVGSTISKSGTATSLAMIPRTLWLVEWYDESHLISDGLAAKNLLPSRSSVSDPPWNVGVSTAFLQSRSDEQIPISPYYSASATVCQATAIAATVDGTAVQRGLL